MQQQLHTALPKRFSIPMREIWELQYRLNKRHGKRAQSTYHNRRFRAAYDFLLLRAESGEDVAEHAKWWTRFQEADDGERRSMLEDKRAPRRRRGAARPEPTGQPAM